jgi:hypothetical protein
MKESDQRQVIAWLDAALEVFSRYRGELNRSEVRIRSLLAVLRQDMAEELEQSKSGTSRAT